jgi:tRNA 5-methylaminomethyl-2-thiouridine biosynthesis bifunctional protein
MSIPTRDGVLFGATHDRGVVETDAREADDRRNLQALANGLPGLAVRLADAPLQGRAAVRATTPDHLPLAGAVPRTRLRACSSWAAWADAATAWRPCWPST